MAEPPLSASVRRVEEALRARGYAFEIRAFPESTRTAAEAAAAIGCSVGEIAKSLVFRAKPSGRAVLVIASGANRVNEQAVAAALGEAIGKADAAFVREKTGFAIGGVAPVGHAEPVRVFIDADLLRLETIWAAAGTPNSVFRLAPTDLVALTEGEVIAQS